MDKLFALIDALNNFLLSVPMLVGLLLTGLIFTVWSGFSQYRSLTHGVALIRGKGGVDTTQGPGALTHFQALTAALSGTVGLGAIAGMAIAVELGGPGAIFWMWTIGIVGMALKSTEVTLALLYRDVSDPKNPHGGTMFVARNAIGGKAGKIIGTAFALALLLFAFTGGNMFQTWSAADTTREYFGVAPWVSGVIIALLAGTVIIGGITRIGHVTKTLVPFKCGVYVLCGLYVILQHAGELPALMRLIFTSAFSATDGRLLWKKDLGPMDSGYFAMPSAQWGYAASPIIHAGKVIVQCDVQKGSYLAVFDLADGREVWRTARADVVIENYRPGVMRSFGLDYPALAKDHPGLIFVSISGYGQTGPDAGKAGYASVAEAVSGLRHMNGFPGGPPPRLALSLGDTLAGMFAAQGALAALYRRTNP